ncbi:MAG: hypothetical protein ACREME_09135 [Gemmatimonadales bacterium]
MKHALEQPDGWLDASLSSATAPTALRWVWRTVHVTGHSSGVFEWTITGSDYGSLFINPAGSSSILFNVTAADPIP